MRRRVLNRCQVLVNPHCNFLNFSGLSADAIPRIEEHENLRSSKFERDCSNGFCSTPSAAVAARFFCTDRLVPICSPADRAARLGPLGSDCVDLDERVTFSGEIGDDSAGRKLARSVGGALFAIFGGHDAFGSISVVGGA